MSIVGVSKYNFFMARFENGAYGDYRNLEDYFDGLRMMTIAGLSSKGKPRVYLESFVEAQKLDVFFPEEITRDSTGMEFNIIFIGDGYRDVYDSFVDFVTNAPIMYYDDCRNRRVEMFLQEAVEPSDEKLYGDLPYIIAPFKFTNYSGDSEKVV